MTDEKKIEKQLKNQHKKVLISAKATAQQKYATKPTKTNLQAMETATNALDTYNNDQKRPKTQFSGKLILSTDEIAAIFHITGRAVRLWAAKGCPRAGHGKWDVNLVLNWWLDNIYQASDDESLAAARRQYWQAKAESETIKTEQLKESVFPKSEIASEWAKRMGEVARGLETWPLRLPPMLEGKSQGQMREILQNEQWKLRDNFCRTGKFCELSKKKKGKRKND